MKSLFAKILLALMASTLLALGVSSALSRLALQRGFVQYLEEQEQRQLELLVPELVEYYRRHDGWDSLRGQPRRWMRLLERTRPEGLQPPEGGAPDSGRSGPTRRGWRDPRGVPPPEMRHRQLWRRLFVLDAERNWIAGARYDDPGSERLTPVQVGGATVGWAGFRPIGAATGPDAQRFLAYQRQSLALAVIAALLFATLLGWWLARTLARPVGRVRETVAALTDGDFSARSGVDRGDEIGDLARHVDRLGETLERNRTAQRRWTADIAHELRTPVTILRAELDAVRDGVRPLAPGTLESLNEEVAQLGRLVDDLQTLAMADSGALEFRFEPVDASALLRRVLEGFASRLQAAHLRLELQRPDRLTVRADASRLRQLMQNLVENSCRYTAAGGTVRVKLSEADGWAELLVEDSAPGPGRQERERLFERFYRGEESRGRSTGGSGLGLAICREIVLAHGGSIAAHDSALGGLAVHVRLPLGR